jgi:DNA-binding transcriptional LysR family regulator
MRTAITEKTKLPLQKRTGLFSWTEIETILSIARTGSLSAAARVLGLEHSTVHRRISAAESRVGFRFFERTRTGYIPRARLQALIDAAVLMEETKLAAEERLLGRHSPLSGEVRLSTSEVLGSYLLPRTLEKFLDVHPEITVEVGVTNRQVDLTRREADLALRVTEQPPEHLIARQIGAVAYAVYGARGRFETVQRRSPAQLPWLGFADELADIAQARWLRDHPPQHEPRTRWGSLIALVHATRRALGVSALPCLAAAQYPDLIQIGPVLGEAPLYILTHPKARENARARALREFLREEIPPQIAQILKRR